ncbi:restriction endonuclease [Streptomyces griseobrunneus]
MVDPTAHKDGDRGSAVGTPDLQRVNGTARHLYGADVVLVVTNGRFSTRCAPLAQQLNIHLADRRVLARWASGGALCGNCSRALQGPVARCPRHAPPRKGTLAILKSRRQIRWSTTRVTAVVASNSAFGQERNELGAPRGNRNTTNSGVSCRTSKRRRLTF